MRDPLNPGPSRAIRPDMTVLDIVSQFKATQAVFKQWDHKAGACICCEALFESLDALALRYGLDLAGLIKDLEKAVDEAVSEQASDF